MESIFGISLYFQVCDSVKDCIDGSDEWNCIQTNGTEPNVPLHQYTCDDPDLQNDLIPDCDNATDEKNFLAFLNEKKSATEFCADPWEVPCYPGFVDVCYQRKDICAYETNTLGHLTPCRNGAHLAQCKNHQCPTMFKCKDAFCISFSRMCDGKKDCPNGEDEMYCNITKCPGLFRCKYDNICVHPDKLCDGVIQCESASDDELFCDKKSCPSVCNMEH